MPLQLAFVKKRVLRRESQNVVQNCLPDVGFIRAWADEIELPWRSVVIISISSAKFRLFIEQKCLKGQLNGWVIIFAYFSFLLELSKERVNELLNDTKYMLFIAQENLCFAKTFET